MFLLFWFVSCLYALRLVCLCPLHGHPQPTTWASADRVLGNCCPKRGQRVPKYRTCFWAIFFLWSLCDVLTDFSWCFNSLFSCIVLSLMILLQYFMILPWYFFLLFPRSLIECKYLCVSNILWYFQRKMRLWYFFFEKKYSRAWKRIDAISLFVF